MLTESPGKSTSTDVSHTQANIQAASKSAGAYFSSWGTWASEKRKGWGTKTPVSSPPPADMKRADAFRREKESVVGGGDGKDVGGLQGEGDTKRRSLFFDAEGDVAREKEKAGEGKI
jgi:hypothetical protein